MRWRFTLNPDTDNYPISEPIGWDKIKFSLKRDKTWHGVFFEYSLPLEFYNDPQDVSKSAYTFLRDKYEALGVEGDVILKVELACDDTDNYTEEGQWKLNFTSYKEIRDVACTVEMNLEPESTLMTFRNRYDQKVNLDSLSSFDGEMLTAYDGIGFTITLQAKGVPVTSDEQISGISGYVDYSVVDTVLAGIGTSDQEAIAYIQFGFNSFPVDEVTNRNDIPSASFGVVTSIQPNWTIQIPGNYTLTFQSFLFTVTAFADTDLDNTACGVINTYDDLSVELWVDVDGTATLIASDTLTGCLGAGDFITINASSLTHAFTVPDPVPIGGYPVKIYVRVEASGTWDRAVLTDKDISWSVNYNQTTRNLILTGTEYWPDSTTKSYLINETGSRILEAVTNNQYRMLSDYYGRTDSEPYNAPSGIDGIGAKRILTNGLMIREWPTAMLTLSFKQFFEGLNAIDNIGIGIEVDASRDGYKLVRVEPMEYFYDDTVVVTLSKIPSVTIEVVVDEHYSQMEIGYQRWEAEEYTGLDEFNTKRTYRTNLTTVRNMLSKLSEFIASGYAIEFTRRHEITSYQQREDWRFDNDTFIICVVREGDGYAVEIGNIAPGELNIEDAPTVYNFRLSPARNALRWLKTALNSYRDPIAADSTVIFTEGTGNYLAEGLMTGENVLEANALSESETLYFDLLADPAQRPVYVPEEWSFEFPMSLTQYTALKAAPTGTIQGMFGQEAAFRDFFVRSIDYTPNQGMASFTLLPKRTYPVDECTIYILQTRGTGSNIIGSGLFTAADQNNLFVFVDGNLMKQYDNNPANNEIQSFDAATGYFTLDAPVPAGKQITIIHLPAGDGHCDSCIHRFDGQGNGTKTVTLTGFGTGSLSNMFVFYSGQLMKYNDANAANNELTSYVGGTEVLTFKANTNPNRELRVFGFSNCTCIKTFSGRGDGTDSPSVTGLGTATLANMLVWYNGEMLIYNDLDTSLDTILSYDSAVPEISTSFVTNPNRELRAVKLENC